MGRRLGARCGESEPQIGLGLTWTNGAGEIRLNIPANEAPIRHARNPHNSATNKVLNLPAGAHIEFDCGVWNETGPRDASAAILRRVSDELHHSHPAHVPAPAPELADAAAHGLLAWHWVDDPGYWVYTAAYDRSAEYNANNKGTTLGWHLRRLVSLVALRLPLACCGMPTAMAIRRPARLPNGVLNAGVETA